MSSPAQTHELLEALSDCAVVLLEAVAVPAYIVDNDLRVRWQNAASRELVGDLRGRLEINSKVAPEDLDRARDAFTQKQNGAEHTELELSVVRRDGALVRVAVSSLLYVYAQLPLELERVPVIVTSMSLPSTLPL